VSETGAIANQPATPLELARRLRRAPARALSLCVYGIAALFAAVLVTALAMPQFGASFTTDPGGVRARLDDGRTFVISPATRITVRAATDSIVVSAASLVPDYTPAGGAVTVARFYRERDRIAAIAASTNAEIVVDTGATRLIAPLVRKPRGLDDLSLDFWLLAGQAALVGLVGLWLRLNRPRDFSSWIFGAACDGVFLAAMSGAVFDARELTADGTLLRAMATLNFIGSNLSAFGLPALFLYIPRPLAPRRAGLAILLGAAILGVIEGLAIIPLAGFYLGLLASVIAMIAILAVQVRRTRGDPAGRAILRWVGATVATGGAFLCVGMAAPALLHLPSLASDGMSIVPLFVIYGGIAFGVGGMRMFVLDAWSYRLILGAVTVMILLVGDLLLVHLLRIDGRVALSLTLLAAAYGYFPLRTLVWNRLTGARAISNDALFRQASLVAFSPSADARRSEWRSLLDRVYHPIEIVSYHHPLDAPVITGGGEALLLPAIADEGALALRFANRGRRLFGSAELTTAHELLVLVSEAENARAEYARGVTEERKRIARDLHDDVSALLLTGLHRSDVAAVRGDVRQALDEIRTMVSSMAQPELALATILADLRFETAERLGSAGAALDWPVGGMAADDDPDELIVLDYSRHKALVSAVREGISNIVRHAGAHRVHVRVKVREGILTISIADDGRGLGASIGQRDGGQGMANLGHRLGEIGGHYRLSALSPGCRLELLIPLSTSVKMRSLP